MAERLSGHHTCTCRHGNDVHVRRVGRCLGKDSYDLACECVGFEHSDGCMELRDGMEEDQRPELRTGPDPHYRHLVDDNGRIDREEPE